MKKQILMATSILVMMISSCGINYSITTRINKDGSLEREILANADSAELSRKQWNEILLFDTDGWTTEQLQEPLKTVSSNGTTSTMNVRARKVFRNVNGEIISVNDLGKEYRNLLTPHETVEKKFRWFYTVYTYKAVYRKLDLKFLVDINEYMTREEQNLWFNNISNVNQTLNGAELYESLSEIESKFDDWLQTYIFVLNCKAIYKTDSLTGNETYKDFFAMPYKDRAAALKPWLKEKSMIDLMAVLTALDQYFGTDHFTQSYEKNGHLTDSLLEKETKPLNIALLTLDNTVEMPGKITKFNLANITGNKAQWTATAYRLVNNDFEVIVESRTTNIWSYILTTVIIAAAYILLRRKMNR